MEKLDMGSLQSSKNGEVMKVQDEGEDMPDVSESKCSEKEREHIAQETRGITKDEENVKVRDREFLDAAMKGSNGIDVDCEGEEKEKDEEEGKDKDLKEGAHEQEEKRKEKKKKDKVVKEVEDEGKELTAKKEKKKEKKVKEKEEKEEEEEEEKESRDLKEKKKKKDDDEDEKEKEKKKDGEKDDDEKEEEKNKKKKDKEMKKDKKKDKKEPKKRVEKFKQKIEKIEAKMQKLVLKKEECLKMLSEAEAEQTTPPQEAQPGMSPREGAVETENANEKGPCERAAETLEERELKNLADDISSITISNTKLEVTTVERCDAAIPTGIISTTVDETVTILATDK